MRRRTGGAFTITRCLSGLIIAGMLFLLAMQLQRPLVFDEVEWQMAARGVLRHGIPVSYPGEDPFVRRNATELMGYPAHYGLWHPPLYVYALAGAFALAGDQVEVARAVGVFFGMVALCLVGAMARTASQRHAPGYALIIPLSVGLCLINPYFMQGILYVDIDNTILLPLMLGFLWTCQTVDLNRPVPANRLLALASLFALLLWAKITTPALLGAVLCVAYLVRRSWWALRNLIVVGILGTVLFVATWAIYAFAAHVPVDFFLRFTFLQKTHYFVQGVSSIGRIASAAHLVLWLMPPFAVLGTVAVVAAFQRKRVGDAAAEEGQWLASVAAVGICVGYTLWVPTVAGKYRVLVVPLLAVAIGSYIAPRLARLGRSIVVPLSIWTVMCLAFYWTASGDLFLVPPTSDRNVVGASVALALKDPRLLNWCLSLLPLLVAPIILILWRTPGTVWDRILVGALGAYMAIAIVQDLRSAETAYSPLTFMVQPGRYAVADSMTPRCAQGEVFAAKDVGVLLGPECRVVPFDENEIFAFAGDTDMVAVLRKRVSVQWVIDSRRFSGLLLYPQVREYIRESFAIERSVGDFDIYRRHIR